MSSFSQLAHKQLSCWCYVGQWAADIIWPMSSWYQLTNEQLILVRVWQMDKQTNGLNLTIISLDFYRVNHWNIVGRCPGYLRLLGQGLVTVATKFKTSVTVACSAGHWSPSRAEILVNGALNLCPARFGLLRLHWPVTAQERDRWAINNF